MKKLTPRRKPGFLPPDLLRDFIDALPGMAERGPLLALAHDGFSLEGYLYQQQRGKTVLLAQAQSRAVNFAAAVADVLGQLPQRPRRAVLASSSATLALLDLPIDMDHPRPAKEMFNLVRWEMEPLLAEQVAAWTIGNFLIGRGIVERDEIERLVDEQTSRRRTGDAPRLGELAVQAGLASREQVEECIALQAQLLSQDEQIVCAWSPQAVAPQPGGRSLWLAAAMDLTVQARWVAACEKLGMRLEGIVPMTGSSLPALAEKSGLLVEEIHAIGSALFRLEQGRPLEYSFRLHGHRAPGEAIKTLLAERLTPDDREVVFHAYTDNAPALAERLSAYFSRPFAAPPAPHAGRMALAAWGARNALDKGGLLARLPGSEPPPPPLKRPQTWAALSAAALLLLVGGYEAFAYIRQQDAMQEIQALIAQKAQITARNSTVEADKQRAQKARDALVETQAEIDALRAELDFHQKELGGRGAFVAAVLAALPNTVGQEIRLESVAETSWFELEISAWALSQAAGYRFVRDLSEALGQWRLAAGDVDIREQSGSAGVPGYSVKFVLARDQEAAAATGKPADIATEPLP